MIMDTSAPTWIDDVFSFIYAWRHRWGIELALTLFAFILIHAAYSVLQTRHSRFAAPSPVSIPAQQSPIQTGPITTYGPNSGVTIDQDTRESGRKKKSKK